jgi:DNA-binding transcriptional ArsR family regulator
MTETLLDFFKALAHESRLRIVGLLAQGERSVQELATLLDLKEPTVSHHLAILKAQGLVSARAEGTTRWHRLDVDVLEGLSRRVLEPAAAASKPAQPETWDAKVLRGFVDADGRLTVIPASRRKRGVVLRWLMTGFEPGRRYPEPEVNAILQERHWDSATLRRELIGHRMLTRENGVYWRLPEAGWIEGDPASEPRSTAPILRP